mgnify:CR=1 FL=1
MNVRAGGDVLEVATAPVVAAPVAELDSISGASTEVRLEDDVPAISEAVPGIQFASVDQRAVTSAGVASGAELPTMFFTPAA